MMELKERPKCQIENCDKFALMLVNTQMMCGDHVIKYDEMRKEKQKEEFKQYLKKVE